MKKVFISQPMHDLGDDMIKFTRKCAVDKIRCLFGEDAVIVNSLADRDAPENVNTNLWFLGRSLSAMAQADVAYFCIGWRVYRGCVIENMYANLYGIPVFEE